MALPFGGIAQLFSKISSSLGKKEGESVIGVDIGTSSIKVVQLTERKGAAILETYGEIALGPYAELEVGQSVSVPASTLAHALNDLMREANVSARVGGVAVPLSASLISVISLPTKSREDLATMIPIEARKYIPIPITEVSLDWFVIPEEEASFLSSAGKERNPNITDVLLVAIRNDALLKFQSVAKESTVMPRFYEIEPFSISRAAYEHDTTPTMVIDFGASSTRVYVIEFGIVDISHTVSRGGQDLTLALAKSSGRTFREAEITKREQGLTESEAGGNAIEYIFSEARRIFLTYQRKEGKAISKVVLVGGGASLKGIAETATRFFDAPVTTGTPFDRVSAPAFIADALAKAGPSFSSAVGLALRALKP
jgi:type IV pilus assembly protein PilM